MEKLKSILKSQKEAKVEKYIRKSLWQEIGSLHISLDSKYVLKLVSISKGESKAITKKLINILFDNGPDSISYVNSGLDSSAYIADKSREIHQILCLTLWKELVAQSYENEFIDDFGLSVEDFIKLEPKAQKHLTNLCIEFGEMFLNSPHGLKLENILQDYLKNTTYTKSYQNPDKNPQFPTVSVEYVNWNSLPAEDLQKRLQNHCQVTNSTCDMFVEALNFNQGPLGDNQLARELHVALNQHKVNNDYLLTFTQLSESVIDMLLKCSDKLLQAFKTLQDCVEHDRLRHLEKQIGPEETHYISTDDLPLTRPVSNNLEKGKMIE